MAVYLFTITGIPVFYHYCGGELEKINYVLKSGSCCGEEEEDTSDNGCCSDESYLLQYKSDFTIKQFTGSVNKTELISYLWILPQSLSKTVSNILLCKQHLVFIPPDIQTSQIISTSVLRI